MNTNRGLKGCLIPVDTRKFGGGGVERTPKISICVGKALPPVHFEKLNGGACKC